MPRLQYSPDGPLLRALGPASVSSLLQIVLNVVNYALWVAQGALLISVFLVLMFPGIQNSVSTGLGPLPDSIDGRTQILLGLGAAMAFVAGVQIIVGRMRSIFSRLAAGDPFDPANVRRLRVIAVCLAALELIRYTMIGYSVLALDDTEALREAFSLTAWFSVLVILVLAEVFREGARLRREAELTI